MKMSVTPFAALLVGLFLATPAPAQDGALRSALARVAAQDWAAAASAVQPAGPVAADIVEWHRLRAGEGLLGDYEAFLKRRPDWPGLDLLRRKGEAAVARSQTPARVIDWFGTDVPATAGGAMALVRALRATGQADRAAEVATRAWRNLNFSADEQAAFLAAEAATLAGRHEARLDTLLWAGRLSEARRMYPLVSEGWQRLAEARIGLREDLPGVDGLIARVPAALAGHPGLAHARFDWRVRKGRSAEAVTLLLERSASAAALGNPAAWAGRRAGLARAALRAGRGKEAWRIASGHHLADGSDLADLEFLAGFAALRQMNDPARALKHFRRLGAAVSTPISLARADYWIGRTEEAAGRAKAARAAYVRAAQHQTAYYGLLAAERAGIPLDAALLGQETFPDWRQAGFMRSSVTEAGLELFRAGDRRAGQRFMLHLAESLDPQGLGQIGDLALSLDDAHLAVLIGKHAAARGTILPRAYYPVAGLVPEGLEVARPLALAIARRESEFDPQAVSPAGARGLMQLMPGTAQLMARKLGLTYEAGKLTSDPAYNARLGAAYLAELRKEFGDSLALVAAGYNAGPGRPRAWIDQIGDPRAARTDLVDWVEMVPFTETRTYIMRVVEALVIYRARLSGQTGPVSVTAILSGRDG